MEGKLELARKIRALELVDSVKYVKPDMLVVKTRNIVSEPISPIDKKGDKTYPLDLGRFSIVINLDMKKSGELHRSICDCVEQFKISMTKIQPFNGKSYYLHPHIIHQMDVSDGIMSTRICFGDNKVMMVDLLFDEPYIFMSIFMDFLVMYNPDSILAKPSYFTRKEGNND